MLRIRIRSIFLGSWIRIELKGRIRIRIKVKNRIRIRICIKRLCGSATLEYRDGETRDTKRKENICSWNRTH